MYRNTTGGSAQCAQSAQASPRGIICASRADLDIIAADLTGADRKRELGGITFRLRQTSKNFGTYRFYREGEGELQIGRSLPEPATKVVGLRDFEGLSTPSHTREKNSDEKNENENELTALYIRDREKSLEVPKSHNPVLCSLRTDLNRVAADLARCLPFIALAPHEPQKGDNRQKARDADHASQHETWVDSLPAEQRRNVVAMTKHLPQLDP